MNKKDFLLTVQKLRWFAKGEEPNYRSSVGLETFMKTYPNVIRPTLRVEPCGNITAMWGGPRNASAEVEFINKNSLTVFHAVGITRGLHPIGVEDFACMARFLGLAGMVFGRHADELCLDEETTNE